MTIERMSRGTNWVRYGRPSIPKGGGGGIQSPAGFDELVLDEQFTGGALNTSRWSVYNNSTFGAPTRIQRYMAYNAVVGVGSTGSTGGTSLKLLSKRENVGAQAFTGGMLDSKSVGAFYPRYGYYEARQRIPHGQGLWPAFWLTARNGGAGVCEVDIMEYFHSTLPGKLLWTLHYTDNGGTYRGNAAKNGSGAFWEAPTYSPGWVTSACSIEPENGVDGPTSNVRFKGYLNGVLVWNHLNTQANYWTTNGGADAAGNMFQIYLQGCQISGDYVGHPDDPFGYSRTRDECISGGGPAPNLCNKTPGGYPIIRAGAPGTTATMPTTGDLTATTYEVDYIRVWKWTG